MTVERIRLLTHASVPLDATAQELTEFSRILREEVEAGEIDRDQRVSLVEEKLMDVQVQIMRLDKEFGCIIAMLGVLGNTWAAEKGRTA